MKLVSGKGGGVKPGDVTAVVPYYGDHRMLRWFLNYYRRLGTGFFVFLDLSAERGLAARLKETADCAVWQPAGFMHPSRALHALNHLRHRYARGQWCLSVEPYDLLVFPRSETRHIRDLIDFIATERRDHVHAMVIDAYGEGPACAAGFDGTRAPPELLPYFDRIGYQTMPAGAHGSVPVLGGVQRRALYGDEPRQAPALNCIPLLKLTRDCYYSAATRLVVPAGYNAPHAAWHSSPTACLLRYAMLSDEVALHAAKQAEAGQLHEDNVTALYPGAEKMAAMSLKTQGSGVFTGSADLLDCGLLNNGQWF